MKGWKGRGNERKIIDRYMYMHNRLERITILIILLPLVQAVHLTPSLPPPPLSLPPYLPPAHSLFLNYVSSV